MEDYYLNIIRTDIELPPSLDEIEFSNGVVLRFCTDAEAECIWGKYKLGDRAAVSQAQFENKIVCLDPRKCESRTALVDVSIAMLLLHSEVQTFSTLKFKVGDGELIYRGYLKFAHQIYADGDFPVGPFPYNRIEKLEREYGNRIDKLLSYQSNNNPHVDSFLSVWNLYSYSPFRFVGLVAMVEGLIGNEKVTNKRGNISTKLDYFYHQILPTLKPLQDRALIGRQSLTDFDISKVWADIYKVRNHCAHGARLNGGGKLNEVVSGLSVLGDRQFNDVHRLALHAVKSLIVWHLQDQAAQENFRLIV